MNILPLLPLGLPIAHSAIYKRKSLKDNLLIAGCVFLVLLLSDLIFSNLNLHGSAYLMVEFGLMVLLPLGFMLLAEEKDPEKCFMTAGIISRDIDLSLKLALAALVIIVPLTIATAPQTAAYSSLPDFFDDYWVLLESFSQEFLFTGFLLVYLMKKTDRGIAYLTSVAARVLFESNQILWPGILAKGVLFAFVAYRTKNISGPVFSGAIGKILQKVFFTFFS